MSGVKFISAESLVERFFHMRQIPHGPSTSAQIVHWVEIHTSDGEVLTDEAKLYMEQHYESCDKEKKQTRVPAE